MSGLMKSGLIKRKNGKYTLTVFGKVIYDVLISIEKVTNNYYWNLKAVDLVEVEDGEFSREEDEKVLDTLIDNEKIKHI